MELHPLTLRGCRAGQCLGASIDLAGNLDSPGGKVVCDLELDRYVLDPANLADELRELAWPAARLPAEDDLQRVALVVVCTLVDEHPNRHARLPRPDVPLEGTERDNIQPVERTSP